MSYRRIDAGGHARRLYRTLRGHFGDQLFKDTDSLVPGQDFAAALLGSEDVQPYNPALTMRAVIYPRVSSLIQKDRHTIASQLHELPLYVERRGWELVRPADYYIDDGRSAKTGKLAQRVNFLRLLDDARSVPRPFDVVVVIDAKRITRRESWRERGMILGTLQDAQIKVAIASTDKSSI
jgi:hypothetical protein